VSDIFAKLFDFDGYQVLVTCDTHPDTDAPLITVRTHKSGLVVSTAIGFAVTDEGEAKRDKAFQSITRERADAMRATLTRELGLA
jgi:hypothetical protein